MTPSFSDDSAFEEEVGLRTDVRIAIDLALDDILDKGEKREVTNVEEEKLTHFAIRDLDLSLTYSWYLAGAHTIAEPDQDRRSPWQPGQTFGDLQAQKGQYGDQVEEIRAYFRSAEFFPGYTLRDVWFTDKFEFLRDYYREFAPEKYRSLYIHSLEIRQKLWNLSDTVGKESDNAALSDFGGGGPNTLLDSGEEEEIRYLISDFHMDLSTIDELSPIKIDVARGTDAIELVLSKLTSLETTSVEQRMFLQKDIHDFFYHYVWKYPALAVSVDTAKGPNADALEQKRLLEFDGFDDKMSAEVRTFTRQAHGIGLLPETDEHVSRNAEKSAYLHSILKETIDPR
jgi:hypothetical protein